MKINGNPAALCIPDLLAKSAAPFDKKIQAELQYWYQNLPGALKARGHPPMGFFVSVSADFSRLTWHTLGETSEFLDQFQKYLKKNPNLSQGIDDLEQLLEAHQPSYLGSWITAQKEDFMMGWYFQPIDGLFKYTLPFLTRNKDLERIIEWSLKHSISNCDRLGRTLVSREIVDELFLKIEAETVEQTIDIGLDLYKMLDLPCPADPVLSVLSEQSIPQLHVSLWLTPEQVIKIGLMLPQSSTEIERMLCDSVGIDITGALAAFEEHLGVNFPTYLEYQQYRNQAGVELHYTLT